MHVELLTSDLEGSRPHRSEGNLQRWGNEWLSRDLSDLPARELNTDDINDSVQDITEPQFEDYDSGAARKDKEKQRHSFSHFMALIRKGKKDSKHQLKRVSAGPVLYTDADIDEVVQADNIYRQPVAEEAHKARTVSYRYSYPTGISDYDSHLSVAPHSHSQSFMDQDGTVDNPFESYRFSYSTPDDGKP